MDATPSARLRPRMFWRRAIARQWGGPASLSGVWTSGLRAPPASSALHGGPCPSRIVLRSSPGTPVGHIRFRRHEERVDARATLHPRGECEVLDRAAQHEGVAQAVRIDEIRGGFLASLGRSSADRSACGHTIVWPRRCSATGPSTKLQMAPLPAFRRRRPRSSAGPHTVSPPLRPLDHTAAFLGQEIHTSSRRCPRRALDLTFGQLEIEQTLTKAVTIEHQET